jgi:hypothetical protein
MKDRYIKMRNSNNYDLTWFYEYYVEQSKHNIDFNTFKNIIAMTDLNNIIDHIDHKFGLTVIYDKDNKFLKVIDT